MEVYFTMLWKNCVKILGQWPTEYSSYSLLKSENWMCVEALFCQIRSHIVTGQL